MKPFHYHEDPMYAAAAAILAQETVSEETVQLDEGVEDIAAAVANFKKGDKTNFGVVTDVGQHSISFKAKDLPVTKISFNQRKIGSKDFVLDALIKLKEDVSLDEAADTSAIEKIVSTLKVGNTTNFGVVKDIGKDYITFKAKDTPLTKMKFSQYKMGSRDLALEKLVKLKEGVELEEGSMDNMSLTDLWDKHAQYDYNYDQGYGSTVNKSKDAMHAIEKFVADKFGKGVATDMKKASGMTTSEAEYAGADESPKLKADIARLRKRHGVKPLQIEEGYGMGTATITAPGNALHGKQVSIFHKFDDGRLNVQYAKSDKKGDVLNLTLAKDQYKLD